MAKIIISGGGATTKAYVDYINNSKGEKRQDEKIIFNADRERGLSQGLAKKYLAKGDDENFVKFYFSLTKKAFNKLGETQEQRLAAMEEVVREGLENLWKECGVKDVKWVAGTHLNTNNPHAHILFNTSAVDAVTGKAKSIPKLPRSWFWREHDENSVLAKLFEAPLAGHSMATPPQIVNTKKPEWEVFFPAKESNTERIEKTLNRLSVVGGISPHWIEHLTDNQTLYVSRQGALTFVRRDVKGYATGHVYENGYKPDDERGFFYVGDPKTARRFIIAETPKEVLSILQLTGHRDLSEVCIVASDKKNTPVALTNFLREESVKRSVRVIWSLGLNREDQQEAGDFAELQIALTESRPEKAPPLEFYTWQPKSGFGQNWSHQIQSKNLSGELNGIIRNVLTADPLIVEKYNESETKNYYEKATEIFRSVEIENQNNEFVVYSKTLGGRGVEFGRFEVISAPGASANSSGDDAPLLQQIRLISIGGEQIEPADAELFAEETDAVDHIKFLYGEKIAAEFLEAERLMSEAVPAETPTADQEQQNVEATGENSEKLNATSDDVIEDLPAVKLSAKEITERLKEIPLEDVMPHLGLALTFDSERREYVYRDNGRSHKIKVKNDLFCDRFNDNRGGKNAINLVMQVRGENFTQARQFLMDNLGWNYIPQQTEEKALTRAAAEKPRVPFVMPERNDDKIHIVHDYLTNERALDDHLINHLIETGSVFANSFGSTVFVYRTADGEIKGAAWRATVGNKRGDFPGTEKLDSWFYLGDIKTAERFIVVEAPIEAISYLQLHPETDLKTTAIVSTSMASVPTSLISLLEKNAGEKGELVIAYNNDKGGMRGAEFALEKTGRFVLLAHKDHHINNLLETTEFSGRITRQVPQLEDWNEDVKAVRESKFYETDAEDAGKEIDSISRPEIPESAEGVQLDSLSVKFMDGRHTNDDGTPREFTINFDTISEFNAYIQREKAENTLYESKVEATFSDGSSIEQSFTVGEDLPDTLTGLIDSQIEIFERMKTVPSFSEKIEDLNAEIGSYKYIRSAVENITEREEIIFSRDENPASVENDSELRAFTQEMLRSVKISIPSHLQGIGKAEVLLARENNSEPFFNIGYRVEIDGLVIESVPQPQDKKFAQGREALSNAHDQIRLAVLSHWQQIGEPRFTEIETKINPDAAKFTAHLLNKTEGLARDFSVRSFEKTFAITPEFSKTDLSALRQWQENTEEGKYTSVENTFPKQLANARIYQNAIYRLVHEGLVEVRQNNAVIEVRGGNPLTEEAQKYATGTLSKNIYFAQKEKALIELQEKKDHFAQMVTDAANEDDREYYQNRYDLTSQSLNFHRASLENERQAFVAEQNESNTLFPSKPKPETEKNLSSENSSLEKSTLEAAIKRGNINADFTVWKFGERIELNRQTADDLIAAATKRIDENNERLIKIESLQKADPSADVTVVRAALDADTRHTNWEEAVTDLKNRIEDSRLYISDIETGLAATEKKHLNQVSADAASENVREIVLGENAAADFLLLKNNPLKGIYDRKAHLYNVAFNDAYTENVRHSVGFTFNYRDRVVTFLDTEENGILVNFRIDNGKSQGKNQNYTLGNLIHEGILTQKDFERFVATTKTRQEIGEIFRELKMNVEYRVQLANDVSLEPGKIAYRINSKEEGDYILFRHQETGEVTLFKQKIDRSGDNPLYSFGEAAATGITIAQGIELIRGNEEIILENRRAIAADIYEAESAAITNYLTEKFGDTFSAVRQKEIGFNSPFPLEEDAKVIGYASDAEIVVYRRETREGRVIVAMKDTGSEHITRSYLGIKEFEKIGINFAGKYESRLPSATDEVAAVENIEPISADEKERKSDVATTGAAPQEILKPESAVQVETPGTEQTQYPALKLGSPSREIEQVLNARFNQLFEKDGYDFRVRIMPSKDERNAYDVFYPVELQEHDQPKYRIYAPSPEFEEWTALKNKYNPQINRKPQDFEITDRSFLNEAKLIDFTFKRIVKEENLKINLANLTPTILASKQQEGRIEKRVAKLLIGHGIAEEIAGSSEFSAVIKNEPFMDLHISKDYGTNIIRLTHYYEQNGDLMHDGEMNFRLKDGKLALNQVAAGFYGVPRYSYDRTFANAFSANLIEQGFEKGTLIRRSDEYGDAHTPIIEAADAATENKNVLDAVETTIQAERVNRLVSDRAEGKTVGLTELVNVQQTRVWLPTELIDSHKIDALLPYTFNDSLSPTGRTASIRTERDAYDFKNIHSDALEQLQIEGEFSDNEIATQRDNAELYGEAIKLQNDLDAKFADKGLKNPFAAVAETGGGIVEIHGRLENGKPNGFPAYAIWDAGENLTQIAVGRAHSQTQTEPQDFYFDEPAQYKIETTRAIEKLSEILLAETNLSVNRIAPEQRYKVALEIEPAGVKNGTIAIAEEIREILHAGKQIGNNVAFNKICERNFGGTRAGGNFDARDAYDALELGVNLYLLDRAKVTDFLANPQESIRELRELMKRLPTQTDRTDEQQLFQQFSTPPTESFAAFVALGAKKGEIALEPSAGNGGLAFWLKAHGIETRVNEISDRRAGILKILGFGDVSRKDAQFLNDTLDRSIKPSLILMNPPFSATGGRTRNRTKYGAEHITDALNRLQPGGRLVAIVGEGMAFEKPAFTNWWATVLNKYTVRANVGIPGEEYGKYGTTFGNQMLVIDKIGATPGATMQEQLSSIVHGNFPNLETVLTEMVKIRATRTETPNIVQIQAASAVTERSLPEPVITPYLRGDLSEYDVLISPETTLDERSQPAHAVINKKTGEVVYAEETTGRAEPFEIYRTSFMQMHESGLSNWSPSLASAMRQYTSSNPEISLHLKAAPSERIFDIGAGHLGNGTTIWNRAERENRDYKTIAHVGETGVITIYDENLPPEAMRDIYAYAFADGAKKENFVEYNPQNDIVYAAINKETGEIFSVAKNFENKSDLQLVIKNDFASLVKNYDSLAPELKAAVYRLKPEFDLKAHAEAKPSEKITAVGDRSEAPANNIGQPSPELYAKARDEAGSIPYGKIEALERRGYRILFGLPDEETRQNLIGILSGRFAERFVEKGLTIEKLHFNRIETQEFISREDLKNNPNKIYLFGDNLQKTGLGGQAAEMRGEKNAIGIPTKKFPANTANAFFSDADLLNNKYEIDSAFGRLSKYPPQTVIVVPQAGLGTGLADLANRAPKTFAYLQEKLESIGLKPIAEQTHTIIAEVEERKVTWKVGADQDSVTKQMELLAALPFNERELEINSPLEDINLSEAGAIISKGAVGYSDFLRGEVEADWEESQIGKLIINEANDEQVIKLVSQFEDVTTDVDFVIDGKEYQLSVQNGALVENVLSAYHLEQAAGKADDENIEERIEERYEVEAEDFEYDGVDFDEIDYGGYVQDETEPEDESPSLIDLANNERFAVVFAAAPQLQSESLDGIMKEYENRLDTASLHLIVANDDESVIVYTIEENPKNVFIASRLTSGDYDTTQFPINRSAEWSDWAIIHDTRKAEVKAIAATEMVNKISASAEAQTGSPESAQLPPIDMNRFEEAAAANPAYDLGSDENFSPEEIRREYFKETFGVAESVRELEKKTATTVFLTKTAELEYRKNLAHLEQEKSDLALRVSAIGEYFGDASESYVKGELELREVTVTTDYDVLVGRARDRALGRTEGSVPNDSLPENQTTGEKKAQTEISPTKGENNNDAQISPRDGVGDHSTIHPGNGKRQPSLFETANSVNGLNAGDGRSDAELPFNANKPGNRHLETEENGSRPSISSAQSPNGGAGQPASERIVSRSDQGESATVVNVNEPLPPKSENLTTEALGIGKNTEKRERIEHLGVVEYKPAKLTRGVQHPADIVESASMAAVVTPDIKYTPKLDRRIIEEGKLSSLQLETVIYAGQRHEMKLPDGSRAGFFIGDGTGVGKGRELAGIALDNWNQGRNRVLWLSINYDLVPSTDRDLKDLGADIPLATLDKHSVHVDLEAAVGDAVLFSSYATLTGKGKDGKTRFDQITKWLGEDGVVMFDEGHLAKNAVAFGRAESSQRGEAVVDLQIGDKSKKEWRFVYSSATGATELRNMAYMQRLGLWGEGSGFPGGFIEFHNTIDRGGTGALEMVARDMKATGMYCSRSLSFRGVDYRSVHHELTEEQREVYNLSASAWSDVVRNFDYALQETNASGKAKGMAYAQLWSSQQMFYRQLMTAIKVPALIRETERVLKNGSTYTNEKGETRQVSAQVVIGIIGTGEARTKDQVAKAMEFGLDLDNLDFSPKQILLNVVERAFPTKRFTEEINPLSGNTVKVPVVDQDGKAVESQEALRMRDELLAALEEKVRLPDNPLDQIVNYFGVNQVAEITGRDKRIIINENGQREYVKRARSGVAMDKASQDEMMAFQAGRKPIAIISQSASTGISLHSELKPLLANYVAAGRMSKIEAPNIQQYWNDNKDTAGVMRLLDESGTQIHSNEAFRRVHITLETSWSADIQMQTFGRTHRSNQLMPPEYVLMSTDLGGEKRFLATIAKRLGSLGALTKGDREQAGGGNLLQYDFENKYGQTAAQKIVTMMQNSKPALMTLIPPEPGTGRERGGLEMLYTMGLARRDGNLLTVPDKVIEELEVSKFLNRVLMLDVDTQNTVFDAFVQEMEAIIQHDKELGLFDEGVKDIEGTNIRLAEEPRVVSIDKATGAETVYYKVNADTPTAPVTLEEIKERNQVVRIGGLEASAQNIQGVFYQQRNSKNIIYTEYASTRADAATGGLVKHYKFARPADWQTHLLTEKDLIDHYVPVRLEERREFKDETVMSVAEWWKAEVAATPQTRVRDIHVIAGAVLPVWQRLSSTNDKGDQLSLKTVRIETEEGERIVGVEIPSRQINRVLRDLGVQQSFKKPDEIFNAVLDTKETIDLVGGIRLRPTFFKKNPAIEIMNLSVFQKTEFQNLGAHKEIVSFDAKFFVPTEKEKGVEVLTKILERYPAVDKNENKAAVQTGEKPDEKKSSFNETLGKLVDNLSSGTKLDDGVFAKIGGEQSANSFARQAADLRDKPLSDYWWQMKAESNEKGQVVINAAAYELLRSAYQTTFRKEPLKFEGLYASMDNADRLIETLGVIEKNCGVYCDAVGAVTKTITEARELRADKSIILLTDEKAAAHEEVHASSHIARLGEDLIAGHARFEELIASESYQIAKPILSARYGTESDGLLVEETFAYVASGDGKEIGLGKKQSADFAELWITSVAEKNPENLEFILSNFEEICYESKQARDNAYKSIVNERAERFFADQNAGEQTIGESETVDNRYQRGEFAEGDNGPIRAENSERIDFNNRAAVEKDFIKGESLRDNPLFKVSDESGEKEITEIGGLLEEYGVATPEGNDLKILARYVGENPRAAQELMEFAADRDLIRDERYDLMDSEQMEISSRSRLEIYAREVGKINQTEYKIDEPAMFFKVPENAADKSAKGDEIYHQLREILSQSKLEKLLDAKEIAVQFETAGSDAKRFELEIKEDEITFSEVPKEDAILYSKGVTLAKNSKGEFQYTGSFERETPEKTTARKFDEETAKDDIYNWKRTNTGEKLLVVKIEATDSAISGEVKKQDEANRTEHVQRGKGETLLAEAALRETQFAETRFRSNLKEEKLSVTAKIDGIEKTREISFADLQNERTAIARSETATDKKTGVLQMIAEDKGLPLERAEKRQFEKAAEKAGEKQKPWIDALNQTVAEKERELQEKVFVAQTNLDKAKAETILIAKQTGIADTLLVKPLIQPEKVWIEQIKAVKRGDTETFEKMEAVHRESGLPRPNDVYARLRGMETIAASEARRERREVTEWIGNDREQDKIIVNVRPKNEEQKAGQKTELIAENWRVQEVERRHDELIKEAGENRRAARDEYQKGYQSAMQPLMSKINPAATLQGKLSWLTDPKGTLNSHINPLEIIKNDSAVQIVRAVAGYVEHRAKAAELQALAGKATEQAAYLKEKFASDVAGTSERLSAAVKSAIEAEESVRAGLNTEPATNKELLATPDRAVSDDEFKRIGETAVKTCDVKTVEDYYEVIKRDAEFAEFAGETAEQLTGKSLLAEAKAVWQANRAIQEIKQLADGSVDVTLNPEQLENAAAAIKTADVIETVRVEIGDKTGFSQMPLDTAIKAESYLESGSAAAEAMQMQVRKFGDDFIKNQQSQQTISDGERKLIEQMSISQDMQQRFEEIRLSENFVDKMANQAEIATQNSVVFQQTAQNYEVASPNQADENKERAFWKNDRQQREAQIAREKMELRTDANDEEKEAIRQSELAEAEGAELEVSTLVIG